MVSTVVVLGCNRPPSPPDNLILIVIDTLRRDHLSCYSGPEGAVRTPNIDALAHSGVLFRQAYCHIPITGPSHASLFTSQLAAEHGCRNNAKVLGKDKETLAEILSAGGLHSAAFVSLGTVKGSLGFKQGFDEYSDRLRPDWFRQAQEVNREVLPWLEHAAAAGQRFFLWVHYSDPHEPYAPPSIDYPQLRVLVGDEEVARATAEGKTVVIPFVFPPGDTVVRFEPLGEPPAWPLAFREVRVTEAPCSIVAGSGFQITDKRFGDAPLFTRLPASLRITNEDSRPRKGLLKFLLAEHLDIAENRRRYALEVAWVDREVGRLLRQLDRLGLRQRSLIALTADHGELLGERENGYVGHVSHLYQPLVQVPLMLSAAGLPAGLEIDTQVSHLDLAPTLLHLMQLPVPSGMRGRSLLPLLRGEQLPPAATITETYEPEAFRDRQAIVEHPYKYIVNWGIDWRELYELEQDPAELQNLIDNDPERARTMHDELLRSLAQVAGEEALNADLSDEDRAALRALGYAH